jgi:hypothetical protein
VKKDATGRGAKTLESVETFVSAAREYVRRAIGGQGTELDGSEASLAFVDHYINETRKGGAIKEQVLALVAPALGAYLGEVAIAKFGGRWVIESDDPATWRIELEPAELRFCPVGMAAEALRHDDVEGYDASFSTSRALMGPLAEALANSPPVSEDYYYSLTGRLETIEQAVDILVELERLKREQDN